VVALLNESSEKQEPLPVVSAWAQDSELPQGLHPAWNHLRLKGFARTG
jgi:hypothetical protein